MGEIAEEHAAAAAAEGTPLEPQSQSQPKAQVSVGGKPQPPAGPAGNGPTPAQAQAPAQSGARIPFLIEEAGDLMDDWFNMMVYAEYGVGKTYLATSAAEVPQMRDVLMIDAESGLKSVEPEWRPYIDRIRINKYSQLARIHEWLKLHIRARDANNTEELLRLERMLKPGREITTPRKYYTLVVDSLSELDQYVMYQLTGVNIGEFKLDMEPEAPQFAEWGKNHAMVSLLIRTLRDLPIHLWVVCSAQFKEDEVKRRHWSPNLPGKLSAQIQGYFDLVGFLVQAADEGGNVERRLYIQPGRQWQAKNRFPGLRGKQYLANATTRTLVQGSGLKIAGRAQS